MLSLEPRRVPPGIRRSPRYQVPVVRVYTRPFAFVVDFVLHQISVLLGDFVFANYTHTTADQKVTSRRQAHSTDRAISSAQVALGSIKSLVALNQGPLFSAPFPFS